MKRSRSQLSAESFCSNTAPTNAVMRKNILSSVKRTRARRNSLYLNENSKQ
jgi:hypothetical protein